MQELKKRLGQLSNNEIDNALKSIRDYFNVPIRSKIDPETLNDIRDMTKITNKYDRVSFIKAHANTLGKIPVEELFNLREDINIDRYTKLISHINQEVNRETILETNQLRNKCLEMREYLTLRKDYLDSLTVTEQAKRGKLSQELTSNLAILNDLLKKDGKLAPQIERKYHAENSEQIELTDNDTAIATKVSEFFKKQGLNLSPSTTTPQAQEIMNPEKLSKAYPDCAKYGIAHAMPILEMGTFHRIKDMNGSKTFIGEFHASDPNPVVTERKKGLPAEIYFDRAKEFLDKFLELRPASANTQKPPLITLKGFTDSAQIEAIMIYAAYLNKYERNADNQFTVKDGSYQIKKISDKQVKTFHNEMKKITTDKTSLFDKGGLFSSHAEKTKTLGKDTYKQLDHNTSAGKKP